MDYLVNHRYRSLTTAFYRDAMGFFLMFDVTNAQSFLNLRNWITQLQTHAYCDTPDIVLCANKIDLEGAKVQEEEIKKFAESCSMPYFMMSAATGQNVSKAVDALLQKVMNRIEMSVDKQQLLGSRNMVNNNSLKMEANKPSSGCAC